MAHRLTRPKMAEFCGLRQFIPVTGAQLAQLSAEEAGEREAKPLGSKKARFSAIPVLRQLVAQTGADWRKLAQQRGWCATHRDTPKGVFPSENWRTSPVRLLDWRNA